MFSTIDLSDHMSIWRVNSFFANEDRCNCFALLSFAMRDFLAVLPFLSKVALIQTDRFPLSIITARFASQLTDS
jgi:hypothetical protein